MPCDTVESVIKWLPVVCYENRRHRSRESKELFTVDTSTARIGLLWRKGKVRPGFTRKKIKCAFALCVEYSKIPS